MLVKLTFIGLYPVLKELQACSTHSAEDFAY
jgi:hypothetical protein